MEHLRMELHAPHRHISGGKGGIADIAGGCNGMEAFGKSGDGVAMAHPHLCTGSDSRHKRICGVDFRQARAAIFTRGCRLHGSAQAKGHELGAIAYAEHRHTAQNTVQLDAEGILVVHAQRAARKNNTDYVLLFLLSVRIAVVRYYLAVDAEFAHTAAYELRGLRPEVHYYDFFCHCSAGVEFCAKLVKNAEIAKSGNPGASVTRCLTFSRILLNAARIHYF